MNGHSSPLCDRWRCCSKAPVGGVELVSRQQIAVSLAIARHLDFTVTCRERKSQRLRFRTEGTCRSARVRGAADPLTEIRSIDENRISISCRFMRTNPATGARPLLNGRQLAAARCVIAAKTICLVRSPSYRDRIRQKSSCRTIRSDNLEQRIHRGQISRLKAAKRKMYGRADSNFIRPGCCPGVSQRRRELAPEVWGTPKKMRETCRNKRDRLPDAEHRVLCH